MMRAKYGRAVVEESPADRYARRVDAFLTVAGFVVAVGVAFLVAWVSLGPWG